MKEVPKNQRTLVEFRLATNLLLNEPMSDHIWPQSGHNILQSPPRTLELPYMNVQLHLERQINHYPR